MTSTSLLLSLPVVLPLLSAGLSLLLSPRPNLQRALGALVLAAVVTDAAVLLARVDSGGPLAAQAGGFRVPLGITLVADRLSALVLVVASAVLLVVFLYAVGQGTAERSAGAVPSVFHPSYLVLAAGIGLALLTGDLFTLFVGLEVMLMASYSLITLGATRERVRVGTTYVVSSLLASILLLTTVGLVYGVTGTVNLADLAVQMDEVPVGLRRLLGVMLLLALGVKAAVVPLHWWLPDSYPSAVAPVTAVFAALLTKVGVYAVVRTQTLLFPRDEPWVLVLVLASVTMLVGILGALAQDDLNRVLSFTLVSHIGFMLMGLGMSTVAGLRGTVIYLVHHVIVQASLFLVVGLVQRERGTALLSRLGGLRAGAPLVAVLFLLPALSLGGVPPFAGFVAKLALLQAGVERGGAAVLTTVAVALLTSLLTLAVTTRAWTLAFWRSAAPGRPPPAPLATDGRAAVLGGSLMRGAAVAMVVGGLSVAVAAGPLSAVADRAAVDLRDPRPYLDAVLDPGGRR